MSEVADPLSTSEKNWTDTEGTIPAFGEVSPFAHSMNTQNDNFMGNESILLSNDSDSRNESKELLEDAATDIEIEQLIPDLDDLVLKQSSTADTLNFLDDDDSERNVHDLPTVQELDARLDYVSSQRKDVDLSILVHRLVPPEFVMNENDEVWIFDEILNQINVKLTHVQAREKGDRDDRELL